MYVKYLENSHTSSCYATEKSETGKHRAHLPIQRDALHKKISKLRSLNTLGFRCHCITSPLSTTPLISSSLSRIQGITD